VKVITASLDPKDSGSKVSSSPSRTYSSNTDEQQDEKEWVWKEWPILSPDSAIYEYYRIRDSQEQDELGSNEQLWAPLGQECFRGLV
jgi:hypothetical protein